MKNELILKLKEMYNKLPFKNLCEKHSEKYSFLGKIAPYANTIFLVLCALITFKIVGPAVKYKIYERQVLAYYNYRIKKIDRFQDPDKVFLPLVDEAIQRYEEINENSSGYKKEIEKIASDIESKIHSLRPESIYDVSSTDSKEKKYPLAILTSKSHLQAKVELDNRKTAEVTEKNSDYSNRFEAKRDEAKEKILVLAKERIRKIDEKIEEQYYAAYKESIIGSWSRKLGPTQDEYYNFNRDGTYTYHTKYIDDGINFVKKEQIVRQDNKLVVIGNSDCSYVLDFNGKYSLNKGTLSLTIENVKIGMPEGRRSAAEYDIRQLHKNLPYKGDTKEFKISFDKKNLMHLNGISYDR